MNDFWDGCVILSEKVRSRTPPKVAMDPLFAVSRSIFFVSLGAQEFIVGVILASFWEPLAS